MGLGFVVPLKSFSLYGDFSFSDWAFDIFSSYMGTEIFYALNSPIVPNEQVPFNKFVEFINHGARLSFVLGNSSNNDIAKYIETNYKQTIELAGIVGFSSGTSLIVTNRFGTFSVDPEQTDTGMIQSAAIFRLRDFQHDSIYISAANSDALAVGMSLLVSIFNGPFFEILDSDDAFLARGLVKYETDRISSHCSRFVRKIIKDKSVSPLRLLDHDIG